VYGRINSCRFRIVTVDSRTRFWMRRVDGWFWIRMFRSLVMAVFTADLIVGTVEAAAATPLAILLLVRLAVHHTVATLTLCGVVHGRSAAARV